ncbi:MAG: class II fructose-bisphosphate aldolase [Granulosicoccus sp.]
MTVATLAEVLQPALSGHYAVAGLVTLGWEDMRAVVAAAEAENAPVILQAGPGCREHTPLPIIGKMFQHLAESASVPVVAHLDHGYSYAECKQAVDCGFTSVMYDGSRKPLLQNIDETAAIVALAHASGVSCEGEIGFVGYAEGEDSTGTNAEEASRFALETKVDAMAISVGNVHLQENKQVGLDEQQISAIESVTDVPLVIHGGSGVPEDQRLRLSRTTSICKWNVGTELRKVFGQALRNSINSDGNRFDRVAILKETHAPLMNATRCVLQSVSSEQRIKG